MTTIPDPMEPSKWEETQAWATKKIADVVEFSIKREDRLLAGHDVRDKLTTLEQRQALLIEQAQKLRRNTLQTPKKGQQGAPAYKNEQLFDMFAEKIAKKLSEIDRKKNNPDLFGPKDGS